MINSEIERTPFGMKWKEQNGGSINGAFVYFGKMANRNRKLQQKLRLVQDNINHCENQIKDAEGKLFHMRRDMSMTKEQYLAQKEQLISQVISPNKQVIKALAAISHELKKQNKAFHSKYNSELYARKRHLDIQSDKSKMRMHSVRSEREIQRLIAQNKEFMNSNEFGFLDKEKRMEHIKFQKYLKRTLRRTFMLPKRSK